MREVRARITGGLTLGAGSSATSPARARRSIRGALAASVLVPLLRKSRRLRNAETLDAAIAKNRAQGPALPPDRLRSRFVVADQVHRGLRTFTVTPRSGGTGATILYLHGGGYTFHLIAPHWTLISGLAEQTGATIVVPLYPLAPENNWEQAFAAVTSLYVELRDRAGGKLFVAGDSAGGGLALALAQDWKAEGIEQPAGLLLFSPFCDGTLSDPAQSELESHDHVLMIDGARETAKRWAGNLPPTDRRISPLFGSMSGLPPLLVITGSHDILYSDANRLHDRAIVEQAEIEIYRYAGMFHVFMAIAIPEGRRALAQAGAFVRDRL